jgi:hypothetical protein
MEGLMRMVSSEQVSPELIVNILGREYFATQRKQPKHYKKEIFREAFKEVSREVSREVSKEVLWESSRKDLNNNNGYLTEELFKLLVG